MLDSLLQGRCLDFRLLVSSLASILGGIGQATYSAANIFMDTFARRSSHTGQQAWLSVNWDVWRTRDNIWSEAGKTLENLGMTGEEAMRAMEATLSVKSGGQIIVSTGSLDARIRQWVKLESFRAARDAKRDQGQRPSRNGETANSDAPSETEEVIAGVWKEVLGFDDISVNDSFFDLGGHSLLAMQIVARTRGIFHVEITLRDFFAAPTICQFSALIREKLILDVSALSDEEVRELISQG